MPPYPPSPRAFSLRDTAMCRRKGFRSISSRIIYTTYGGGAYGLNGLLG
jgi:hypothetical protein